MSDKDQEKVIILLERMIKRQEQTNEILTDLVNLFKKYEIDEVLYSENLRED